MIGKKGAREVSRSAALYCRVSTIDQGKADFSSLDTQEEMLREYCERKGWKIYKVYTDTKSGKTLDRPEIAKLFDDAKQGKFAVVVATKFDRLSRSVKDFLELDAIFQKQGIDIVVTTQQIDTTTPAGQMQRTVMMAFAQFEREMIAERTRESAYMRAQKGFWLGGNVPLGYDVIDKKLVVNKQEAELVRIIFKLYLEIPSTKALTRKLNSLGYRSKSRITRAGKKTGGKEFNHQLIHDILRNRIYTGWIKVNKETFKGLHDSIIDDVLFDHVQKRLDQSVVDTFAAYEGSPLLLLGTTKCGFCGKNLTTYFANNGKNAVKHYYYKCTTTIKHGAQKCPSRLLPARDLEEFSQGLMIHTARNVGFFDAVTSQIKDNSDDEILKLNEDRQKLNGNLSTIEKRIANLIDNLTDAVFGREAKRQLENKLESLEKQKRQVEQALSELDRQIDEIQGKRFQKQVLNQVMKEFDVLYKQAPMQQKRDMLRTVIEEVKVSAKRDEKDGTFEFKLRGNGTVVKQWNEVVNKRGAGLTPHVESLRE